MSERPLGMGFKPAMPAPNGGMRALKSVANSKTRTSNIYDYKGKKQNHYSSIRKGVAKGIRDPQSKVTLHC